MTIQYPKWLYHAEQEAVIVKDKAEHDALGPEWVESPALIIKSDVCGPGCPQSPIISEEKPTQEISKRRRAKA